MKHKKFKLLALPLAVASASVIGMVSGTLAYFTSQDKATVSIEAGQVKVSLAASDLKVYSLGVEQTATGNVDSKTVTYFENGGYAVMEGNVITLDRITPGDKVTFDVKFKNESNVDIKYAIYPQYVDEESGIGRTDAGKVVPHTGDTVTGTSKLSAGLTFTYTNESSVPYDGSLMTIHAGSNDVTHALAIELPAAAGNEYQGAKSKIVLNVFAYQNNAPVTGIAYNWATLKSQAQLAANSKVFLMNDVVKPADARIQAPAGVIITGEAAATRPTITCAPEEVYGSGFAFAMGEGFTLKDLDVVEEKSNIPGQNYHMFSILSYNEPFDINLINCNFIGTYHNEDTGLDEVRGSAFFLFGNINPGGNITIKGCHIEGYNSVIHGPVFSDTFESILIEDSYIEVADYTINFGTYADSFVVRNSTFKGWTSFAGCHETVLFDKVKFMKSKFSPNRNALRAYDDVLFNECELDSDFYFENTGNTDARFVDCKIHNLSDNSYTNLTKDTYTSTYSSMFNNAMTESPYTPGGTIYINNEVVAE